MCSCCRGREASGRFDGGLVFVADEGGLGYRNATFVVFSTMFENAPRRGAGAFCEPLPELVATEDPCAGRLNLLERSQQEASMVVKWEILAYNSVNSDGLSSC